MPVHQHSGSDCSIMFYAMGLDYIECHYGILDGGRFHSIGLHFVTLNYTLNIFQ